MAIAQWQWGGWAGLGALVLALNGCGGSSHDPQWVALAPSLPGVPAPCAAAFDEPGTGLGKANTSPHDSDNPHQTPSWQAQWRAGAIRAAHRLLQPAHADGVPTVALSACARDAQGNITIGGADGCGPHVVIDQDFTEAKGNALGKITILPNGKLAVPHALDGMLEVETTGISVAGVLSLGTHVCPVGGASHPYGRVKVTFIGQADSAGGHEGHSNGRGSDKGIEVLAGGTLRLYGAKGVGQDGVNWTHLRAPAGPVAYQSSQIGLGAAVPAAGERTLQLANDVQAGGWQAGDWIVLATSSFSPFESEFVQIDTVTAHSDGTSTVTLRQPLRHYHFGGPDPGRPSDANYGAGQALNFGVDERTEVGLISRALTLTARTPNAPALPRAPGEQPDPYLHWGGELRILKGYAEVGIQGVELEKFGKARLGSYPIHFHMADQAGPHLVDSNSIHHSYNKCVTVHRTQGVSISNNVCARAVGHLFYQELAQEQGGAFVGNLGIGAQSHYFGLAPAVPRTADGLVRNYWEGDYLARLNGYDSLEVPNMDARDNPMRGVCYHKPADGNLLAFDQVQDGQCPANTLYVEAASGFWIGNPGTVLEGNSVAGCQGAGKGYWYVPPQTGTEKFEPLGRFKNNRVHACYDGLFGEQHNTASGQLLPKQEGASTAKNIIGRFEGLTATRNRNRGVWVRPLWYSVENGRFATNRDSVTLLTSGGPDGNAPGVWGRLADSVLVGISTNNVDRWGPCADLPQWKTATDGAGCVDFHVHNPLANEYMDKGYQSPRWNSAGYMIYDGPVRILRNHFVNFKVDIADLLTHEDAALLATYRGYAGGHTAYEGDAALGWFQSNVSAYPTASVTKALSYDNVDFRHQIYTENVNLGNFMDGDMNTAIIDLDGTLTGYRIVDAQGQPIPGEYPISLNNLPFNRHGNAVDECLAEGAQDAVAEGRPTSLISPANLATLEFEALNPQANGSRDARRQDMLFTRDWSDPDRPGVHEAMRLHGRNDNAVWEPKVASGGSYSVRAMPSTMPGFAGRFFGMPHKVQVGLTDGVKSRVSPRNPFYVRVGMCYTSQNGQAPAGNFSIVRGYKSWGSSDVNFSDPDLWPYFNYYDGNLGRPRCFNLDGQNPSNLDSCPAAGVIPQPAGGCPAGSVAQGNQCVFPTQTYQQAQSLSELTLANGEPAATDKYFYDAQSGMLYFYVLQDSPNAHGAAPLGSCPGDAACPGEGELDTYYPCPPQGCSTVMVTLDDPDYVPGESRCDANSPGQSIYGADGQGGFSVPAPAWPQHLAFADSSGPGAIVTPQLASDAHAGYAHWVPQQRAPSCPTHTAPATRTQISHNAARAQVWADMRSKVSATLVAPWQRAQTQLQRWSSKPAFAQRAPAVDVQTLALSQICRASASEPTPAAFQ